MTSDKIKIEFERIEKAKKDYIKEYTRLNNLTKYYFLGFMFPYFSLAIIIAYKPLKIMIDTIQYLNTFITIIAILFMLFFMSKSLKASKERKKLKGSIGLTIEEDIFYEIYITSNKFILYKNELNKNRKSNIMKEIRSSLIKTSRILNKWNIGPILYLNMMYGNKYDKIKSGLNLLDLDKINRGDIVNIDKLYQYLIAFLEYLCERNNETLNIIIKIVDELPLKVIDVKVKPQNLMDAIYEQPKLFSLSISLIASGIFFILTLYFELGIGAILTILVTTFGIAFQISYMILKEPKEIEKIQTKVESQVSLKVKDELKIPDKNIIFNDDFEYDPSSLNELWKIRIRDQGKAIITKEINGALGSSSCLKIECPIGSNVTIKREFNVSSHVKISYYLRQKYIHPNNAGSPFIIESPIRIRNNTEQRVVYMDIFNGHLRHGLNYQNVCSIRIQKWYKIELIVNCIDHTYEIMINDYKMGNGDIHPDFKSVNAIRTKHFSRNETWITYIDEIEIINLEL